MSNILTLPDSDTPSPFQVLAEEFRNEFSEMAESAERELSGRNFIFNRYGKEVYPYIEESEERPVPGCIFPIKEGRPVASVDSTCILVGETSEGALYASRAAVGISLEGGVKTFFRLGPILVYISRSGVTGLGDSLTRPEVGMALSDHGIAERLIRNTIERKVVGTLLLMGGKTIVMADGSLKHPLSQLSNRLPVIMKNGGCLVGFSKSSSLIFSEKAVSSLTKTEFPCYHMLEDTPVKTVLAKFASDGLVFRIDVAQNEEQVVETLGRILWNDAFSAGYPESLKLAHHLSVFSKADDQALKAYVTKRFRVKRLPTFTLRRVALGSFKGGA